MSLFSIGKLARHTGVGVETIRYYERRGLLAEPERKPSGYRQYTGDVADRLAFILRSKQLGFTLEEIKVILTLRFDDKGRCEHIRAEAERKHAEIEDKIRSLQSMKRSLRTVIDECQESGLPEECPLWNTSHSSTSARSK